MSKSTASLIIVNNSKADLEIKCGQRKSGTTDLESTTFTRVVPANQSFPESGNPYTFESPKKTCSDACFTIVVGPINSDEEYALATFKKGNAKWYVLQYENIKQGFIRFLPPKIDSDQNDEITITIDNISAEEKTHRFDVHCHLFGLEDVFGNILFFIPRFNDLIHQISALSPFAESLTDPEFIENCIMALEKIRKSISVKDTSGAEIEKDLLSQKGTLETLAKAIPCVNQILQVADCFQNSPSQNLDLLTTKFENDPFDTGFKYIKIPLMVDFFCSLGDVKQQETIKQQYKLYIDLMQTIFDAWKVVVDELRLIVDTAQTHTGSKDGNSPILSFLDGLLLTPSNEIFEKLGDLISTLSGNLERFNSVSDLDTFDKQIALYSQIAQNTPDCFPFLGVDPRRNDILNLVKKYVGYNKPFKGIKLYPSLGFSPTDPVLFGTGNNSDCVYGYCMENDIPITTHASPGGFATFVGTLYDFSGTIYRNKKLVKIEKENLQFQYVIDDPVEILNPGFLSHVINERQLMLNHPAIWETVLAEFSELRINFAHFGGDSVEWREIIQSMMEKYPYVYADLSCFANEKEFVDVAKLMTDTTVQPNVKNKILFGTDFYMFYFSTSSLKAYLNNFWKYFKPYMKEITWYNPRDFFAKLELPETSDNQ